MAVLAAAAFAVAAEIPKYVGHVNDFAKMLSSGTATSLEQQLKDFEAQTSTEVAVVTIESLEGEDLEGYSHRLAESWGVGQKNTNNGVVLLIAKADKKIRIEVGRGLEGALPDIIAKEIVDLDITPSFKEGKFDEGVTKGVAKILSAVRGEYTASPAPEGGGDMPTWLLVLIIAVVIFLIIATDGQILGVAGSWTVGGGGGGGGGGFGGGSFGGGGASGSW